MMDDDAAPESTLSRADLRNATYRACPNVSREEVRNLVDATLAEISEALALGETVKLHGFGIFKVKSKRERIGRNPKTSVAAPISPRRVIIFKASPLLKELVNGEGVGLEKPVQAGSIPVENLNEENDE
jgi:integration host factor subunit alpha